MEKLLILSNLGTIAGIEALLKILGKTYIFPKISFFSLDYGMFRPEDSHFVLYNTSLIKTENKISFNGENKSIEITYSDSSSSKYFNGNKTGSLKYDDSIYYIEFSTEDYFIEVHFNKNDFFPFLHN